MQNELFLENNQANETISKFKLLSAYGGPGSIIHTPYGSIIISCIEEWGFLEKITSIHKEATETKIRNNEREITEYVIEQAQMPRNGNIVISNDTRLREALKDRKGLKGLKYLVLIPDIAIKDFSNKIKDNNAELAINSSFMPKVFSNRQRQYKTYKEWFKDWIEKNKKEDGFENKKFSLKHSRDNGFGNRFFPPKYMSDTGFVEILTQDNIVLICEHGHISDFPWSRFLRWRTDDPMAIYDDQPVDLFRFQTCCGTDDRSTSKIKITSSTANASGFDGKWLKCESCGKQISLKGLMSLKIKCPGHKPWESPTGELKFYSGNKDSRNKLPPHELCISSRSMKVALTTGNNIYFSRILSSIYMPDQLFMNANVFKSNELKKQLDEAKDANDFEGAIKIMAEIKAIENVIKDQELNNSSIDDFEKDILYRVAEFNALTNLSEKDINIDNINEHLKVKDVTNNLNDDLKRYFSRILRIDNMKITSAQLDFSRVQPADSDSLNISSKNIFKTNNPETVQVYPVVENYGEGIFLSFDQALLDSYSGSENVIRLLNNNLQRLSANSDDFSRSAISYGVDNNWQLYLVHTFSHLMMKELEFRCGYPTASLSERLYVSNDAAHRMYGCMIYTTEGAEGSMGGVIAQTSIKNLNELIFSALKRATICNSDPLCWESEGQGLFELNFASCFSCSLVSETSCEHRNIYLDRRILVDGEKGFFKDLIKEL